MSRRAEESCRARTEELSRPRRTEFRRPTLCPTSSTRCAPTPPWANFKALRTVYGTYTEVSVTLRHQSCRRTLAAPCRAHARFCYTDAACQSTVESFWRKVPRGPGTWLIPGSRARNGKIRTFVEFPAAPRDRIAVAAYPFREFIVGWKGWDGNSPGPGPLGRTDGTERFWRTSQRNLTSTRSRP